MLAEQTGGFPHAPHCPLHRLRLANRIDCGLKVGRLLRYEPRSHCWISKERVRGWVEVCDPAGQGALSNVILRFVMAK